MSKKKKVQEANLSLLIKEIWVKRDKKQVQNLHIQAASLVFPSYLAAAIEFTLNNQFGELITDFFKEYTPGCKRQYFRDWLAFHNQQHGFYIDKYCWVYISNLVIFWDYTSKVSLVLAKLANRLIKVLVGSVPG